MSPQDRDSVFQSELQKGPRDQEGGVEGRPQRACGVSGVRGVWCEQAHTYRGGKRVGGREETLAALFGL